MTSRTLILIIIAIPELLQAQAVDFTRDIRPILSSKCFACHGPDAGARKADLRLDMAKSVYTTRGSRAPAIVPGQPEQSTLILRVTAQDVERRMPPAETHKEITPAEVEVLRRWINQGARYARPWALVKPEPRPAPGTPLRKKTTGYVDRWILARLHQEGLNPAPETDPVTLVRRLHLDLTGFPPSPVEISSYLEDQRPDRYERTVDRLLASAHYGERMAMYWLDLVRFADTVGYHGDQDHAISPYRDWVIDAFNENMPFDRFTVEQIAGDLLEKPTLSQQIATGYNRLLQTTHEGGAQAKEYLTIYSADRVRNLGSVWMGATIGCAQCHDHKYDPYTQKDFYSLAAFFADIQEKGDFAGSPNRCPTTRPPEIKLPDGRQTMVTVATKPRTIRVLPRGDWLDETGEVVEPAVPAVIGGLGKLSKRATRLDLARWLISGKHPQTARVFTNRLWHLFFGRGLAADLDDLGAQGEPPDHPELLDALAIAFVDSGWDVKSMVRLLVTSDTYRQSSQSSPGLDARDPHNRLFARQSAWRLPAEFVRDVALSASGLIVRKIGGPSVKPYQPAGYYRNMNFPTRKYRQHEDNRQWRRGLYVHWQRMFLHPMLLAFDAPTREECCAERARSNTPKAALTLLNDPTFVEAARALAARMVNDEKSQRSRIDLGFRLCTSRTPTKPERSVLLQLLKEHRREYAADPQAARKLLSVGLSPTPSERDPAELAAWTSVARTLLNLGETYTRR